MSEWEWSGRLNLLLIEAQLPPPGSPPFVVASASLVQSVNRCFEQAGLLRVVQRKFHLADTDMDDIRQDALIDLAGRVTRARLYEFSRIYLVRSLENQATQFLRSRKMLLTDDWSKHSDEQARSGMESPPIEPSAPSQFDRFVTQLTEDEFQVLTELLDHWDGPANEHSAECSWKQRAAERLGMEPQVFEGLLFAVIEKLADFLGYHPGEQMGKTTPIEKREVLRKIALSDKQTGWKGRVASELGVSQSTFTGWHQRIEADLRAGLGMEPVAKQEKGPQKKRRTRKRKRQSAAAKLPERMPRETWLSRLLCQLRQDPLAYELAEMMCSAFSRREAQAVWAAQGKNLTDIEVERILHRIHQAYATVVFRFWNQAKKAAN